MFTNEDIALLTQISGVQEKDEFTEEVSEGMPVELLEILKEKQQQEKANATRQAAELIWELRTKAIALRKQRIETLREIRRQERIALAEVRKIEEVLQEASKTMNYLPVLQLLQSELIEKHTTR